jgi:HEPN domain-containing protein
MERSADWMDQANGDLEHAKSDLGGEFYDWACYSAQQAGEKAVKALLYKHNAEAWGHSIADLLEEVETFHQVPEGLRDKALELDKMNIATRYPNAHPSGAPRHRYTRTEATRMINYAEEICQYCEGILSST